jgi:CRISPR-associated protein Cas1
MLMLLDAGVSLTLVARSGRLRGRLQAPQARNLPLRQAQYARAADPAFGLQVSRAVVAGKLDNCRTLAMRILRKRKQAGDPHLGQLQVQLERLNQALQRAPQAESAEVLRGLEGNGTRAYFAILRAGLQWQGQPFERRTRRPPKDPVNALLSFGYALLTDALFTAAEIVGLDPYAGFFHADKYGRPALALDLVEEFRPLIVDSVVLTLINKRMIAEKHFEPGKDQGVYLTRRGLRIFFQQFVGRLNTTVVHPAAGRAISYQKCFEVQARQLRKFIEGGCDRYQPFSTK